MRIPLVCLALLAALAARAEDPKPADVGSRFVFRALGFAHNTAELDPASYVVLKLAAERMLEVPDLRVRIEGHTDNTGGDAYNLKLSARRAKHVKQTLVALGVADDRLETLGLGSTRPLEANESSKGRALNRRVEFIVIGR